VEYRTLVSDGVVGAVINIYNTASGIINNGSIRKFKERILVKFLK
jgi:hypothetical protein